MLLSLLSTTATFSVIELVVQSDVLSFDEAVEPAWFHLGSICSLFTTVTNCSVDGWNIVKFLGRLHSKCLLISQGVSVSTSVADPAWCSVISEATGGFLEDFVEGLLGDGAKLLVIFDASHCVFFPFDGQLRRDQNLF